MAFDLHVQKTDPKTGKVSEQADKHYVLHISEGEKRYERPIGSGYYYSEDGVLLQQPKQVETKADKK